jgi:hypothetical protein
MFDALSDPCSVLCVRLVFCVCAPCFWVLCSVFCSVPLSLVLVPQALVFALLCSVSCALCPVPVTFALCPRSQVLCHVLQVCALLCAPCFVSLRSVSLCLPGWCSLLSAPVHCVAICSSPVLYALVSFVLCSCSVKDHAQISLYFCPTLTSPGERPHWLPGGQKDMAQGL